LIQDNQPFAKMDHISYLARGVNYPKTTFESRKIEED